ncbi:uncharacterized protein LOC129912056 [Episyrphus balteatus]|uniref:uncharacterized protein LOC129912056 n=1 Tax=Episyrphus balteatus TaxID=286459 RepID=UPI0024853936|nr:uncharacterized protein LOC129912056 [Episyrphus balteatus]
MSAYSENVQEPNFTDIPMVNVFSKWLNSFSQIPTSTWFAQIVLLMLTWYTMKFTFRLVMSILWPLLIITTVVVIFHSIHHMGLHNLEFYICEKIALICHLMVRCLVNIIGFFVQS